MAELPDNHDRTSPNGLIDEVRRIRRGVCEAFDHDIDKLCDHLEEVERQYAAGEGVFAGVTAGAAARVEEGWGEDAHCREEPLLDEMRAIRRKRGE